MHFKLFYFEHNKDKEQPVYHFVLLLSGLFKPKQTKIKVKIIPNLMHFKLFYFENIKDKGQPVYCFMFILSRSFKPKQTSIYTKNVNIGTP